MSKKLKIIMIFLLVLILSGCGIENGENGEDDMNPASISIAQYKVFAWNDLGMHCVNPTFDTMVILPPYNTLYVQVIKRGNPPRVVTQGIVVEYSILNNTYSYGKTDKFGADFAQFWDYAFQIFGIDLPQDRGLNLHDPNVHNSLSGTMQKKGDYFIAEGIPVVPVDDSGVWNPYQVAEITVKDTSGKILARTTTTVPVSDEINCQKCHGSNAFYDILSKHDQKEGTNLTGSTPVLCNNCHGSPALGDSSPKQMWLSEAIHGFHKDKGASCYDCHPGQQTMCNRSLAHTASDGNCTHCHGDMTQIADSIKNGRTPWLNEPKCSTCHQNIPGVDTGKSLYRNARGHGNLFCAVCHGSPHAMVPTSVSSDNYQAVQYQGKAKTIGSCGVCHRSSRGGDSINEFSEKHAGGQLLTACHVCHTQVSLDTNKWPHSFRWKSR